MRTNHFHGEAQSAGDALHGVMTGDSISVEQGDGLTGAFGRHVGVEDVPQLPWSEVGRVEDDDLSSSLSSSQA